jgi:hypothetical protein
MKMDEDNTDALLTGACGTFNLPPDGTADREQIDRFADFLRWYGGPNDPNRPQFTDETRRWAMGEDIAPTPPTKETAS